MNTKAVLLVVGGDSAAPFKRLAEQLGVSERVIFAGARNDLPRIYPAADAFVLPTLYETFALVCLEAMASGLPVLACRLAVSKTICATAKTDFTSSATRRHRRPNWICF